MTVKNISALFALPMFIACGGEVSAVSNLVTRTAETTSGPASAMAENKNAADDDSEPDADTDDPGLTSTDRGLSRGDTSPNAKVATIGEGTVEPGAKPEKILWEGLTAARGERAYFCAWKGPSLFCWGDGALFARQDHDQAIVDVAANDRTVAVVLDSGEVVYHGQQPTLASKLVEVEANAELFCGLDLQRRASCSDGRALVDTGALRQLVMGATFVAALAQDTGRVVSLDGNLGLPSQPPEWTKLVATGEGVCGYRAGAEGAYRCIGDVAYALRQDNDKGAELWASGRGALCRWDGDAGAVCGSTRTGVAQDMGWTATPRLLAPVDGGGCGVRMVEHPWASVTELFCWGDQADLDLPTP